LRPDERGRDNVIQLRSVRTIERADFLRSRPENVTGGNEAGLLRVAFRQEAHATASGDCMRFKNEGG
jgi:hypothetical protein